MKRVLATLSLGAGLLAASGARACPCSDDASSGVSLTRADERYAASLVATSRHALGRFDAQGDYRALRSDEAEASEELLLRAALRYPARLEWLAELGYASYRFHAGRVVERRDGFGDAALRARFTASDESMPHERIPWPALSLALLLRAPLGVIASGRSNGFGSGGPQLGLGAWEAGAGFDLVRSLSSRFDVSLAAEAAYRFEDHALVKPRRLGPRFDAALGTRAALLPWLSASCALRARVTGDVSYAGVTLPGTAERLLSVVVGGAVSDPASGFRSALTLSFEPPVELFSVGSTATTALGVALGYAAK